MIIDCDPLVSIPGDKDLENRSWLINPSLPKAIQGFDSFSYEVVFVYIAKEDRGEERRDTVLEPA